MYLLNAPSFSSRYFNKIKRASRLGREPALSLEILLIPVLSKSVDTSCGRLNICKWTVMEAAIL